MNIVQRATRIVTQPRAEWPVAGAEPATTGQLLVYAAIVSGVAQLVSIGLAFALATVNPAAASAMALLGPGMLIGTAVAGWVVNLVLLYVMALIAGSLAGSFEGRRDTLQALKLLTFAATPVWLAAILGNVPFVGWLIVLVSYGYAIYLIALGAPHTVGVPPSKTTGYTAVVAILWIVLGLIANAVIAVPLMMSVFSRAAAGGSAY